MKLKNYVHLGTLMMLIMLTSCEGISSQKNNTLNIYQPSILRPLKAIKIQTVDGIYEVQTEAEIWHSDKRFRDLERSIYSR